MGEPGSGKTRTAEELAGHAERRGLRVLWGRCDQAEGAPICWPWLQIVRSYVGSLESEPLERGPDARTRVAEAAALRERLAGREPEPDLEPEQARFQLFDGLATFLKRASGDAGLALVLDDLHWADRPSLAMLRFLARELSSARMLVVATYRDLELSRRHPLPDALGELVRLGVTDRVVLRGLVPPEIARLIEISTGVAPAPQLVAAVHRHTEGNPLFVQETVRLLASEGRLAEPSSWVGAPIPLAGSIRETIGQRLNQLSEPCNDALRAAAVLGRDFSLDVLERIVPGGQTLGQVLADARTARVIDEDPEALGRYRFAHALIRETLYDEIRPARRSELHGRVSAVLEELYGASLEAHLNELAYHTAQSVPAGGDVDRAIGYSRQAAERATRLGDYEDAIPHYERALGLLDRRERPDPSLQFDLRVDLARAQARGLGVTSSRETALRALEQARAAGNARWLARAAVVAAISYPNSPGEPRPEAVAVLDEAIEALGDDRCVERVYALIQQVRCFQTGPMAPRALALVDEAVELARSIGDARALAPALQWRALLSNEAQTIRENAYEALSLAQGRDDVPLYRLPTYELLQHAAFMEGDRVEYERLLGESERLATRRQNRNQIYMCRRWRADLSLLEAKWEEGRRRSEDAYELGLEAVGRHQAEAVYRSQQTVLMLARDEHEALIAGCEGASRTPYVSSTLAALYAWAGRTAEARALLEELARDDFASVPHDQGRPHVLCWLAEACVASGDHGHAERLVPALSQGFKEMNMSFPWAPPISHALGALAGLLDRGDEAVAHFGKALRYTASLGVRMWHAHAQCGYARFLADRGRPGDVAQSLRLASAALAFGHETGTAWTTRCALELMREIEDPPASSKRPARAQENLFRLEGEYWVIRFEGETIRLKDLRGLRDIARMLERPGQELHVAELFADAPAPGGLHAARGASHDRVTDARARADYRARIVALRVELEESEARNDPVRSTRLREELDTLTSELAASLGLGGRPRQAADPAERARKAVSMRIRYAVGKAEQHHPALGRHLRESIQTGLFCSYDPRAEIRWSL